MSELEDELRELERTDPAVRAAAESLAALPAYVERTARWKAARETVRAQQRDLVRQCIRCGKESQPEAMGVWRDADGEGHWRHSWCVDLTTPAAEEEKP